MTVYQAGHAGQPGWNDCLLLDGKRPARPPTTCKVDMISRAPQAPPPPTATTKTTTAKPEEDETAESGPEVGLDEVMSALGGVLGLDTSLPSREVAHYRTKLERVLPTVDPVHYPVMHDALTTRQKDTLVSYSLVHNGVSSWVLPLRKIIESVKD
ncbi:hypothetical protein TRICI_005680 [Trichomonascus ciferrii]|uniref:Uncharacterized protein n=1 Tax=Trichomonascus ciferrii TaxID=44093 RepID=A0A642UQ29_9ASCO|nr:hypothetical protein TRICI_005680 [Trichomonascus ciferrii]